MNNTKCRLINPCKSELGKVSKQMLAKIISAVKSKSQLKQWKNSDSVIDWFSKFESKERLHFIQFDLVNFYGSITPDLVEQALTFATGFVRISDNTKSTILKATNSFMCSEDKTWVKKLRGIFDITMGGFHGAEICDLVGLFILSKLKDATPNIELYRNDGLAVIRGTCRQTESVKKSICNIFENLGLEITIEANSKSVNFLDVN